MLLASYWRHWYQLCIHRCAALTSGWLGRTIATPWAGPTQRLAQALSNPNQMTLLSCATATLAIPATTAHSKSRPRHRPRHRHRQRRVSLWPRLRALTALARVPPARLARPCRQHTTAAAPHLTPYASHSSGQSLCLDTHLDAAMVQRDLFAGQVICDAAFCCPKGSVCGEVNERGNSMGCVATASEASLL
jgi:hypothetical protein